MKTIKDLNNKIAYRAVKVLYLILITAFTIISTVYIYDDSIYYPMDENRTRITCKNIEEQKDIRRSDY